MKFHMCQIECELPVLVVGSFTFERASSTKGPFSFSGFLQERGQKTWLVEYCLYCCSSSLRPT